LLLSAWQKIIRDVENKNYNCSLLYYLEKP
jgi:hypothetical protein